MGFKLVITEFDVNDRMAPTNAGVRDRMVADYGRAYLDLMLVLSATPRRHSAGECATL